ncbi:hypothetical protein CC1G_04310 [Coprinopsis cinerea okayama7|uniref:Phosphatidylinositol N-acetylglucosaminyltransferase subunit H conserved domain-containing protein n=1 Tax=Coprinopsis cinerea (strain Okayama-7 / 130 / ATCC MYA-4618 / FGSC 9003) TaxID=240176 RepID=A8NFN5_COPC7|nr:hypothetical protein CC1G_04310 [Coprinopsis cinerea okayama7\|eukprot:XP_001833331.2 hypothetical protein CC1G_04310 [Coprinopsis cinerea okayama7\
MQRIYPLPSHLEFSISKCPQYREYKLENKTASARSQVRRVTFQAFLLTISLLAWNFYLTGPGPTRYTGTTILLSLFLRNVCSGIVHESLVVIPCHGIQIETHRGFLTKVLSSSREFIPFSVFEDLIINEALYGWNVRYYIAVLTQSSTGAPILRVGFPNMLPHFPILQEIYTDIQDLLPRRQVHRNNHLSHQTAATLINPILVVYRI